MIIVFILNHIYLHGGIEKVTTEKANYFADMPGVEVVLLTHSQNGQEPIYPLDSKVELIDLGVNYDLRKSLYSPQNAKKFRFHYKALKKTLKKLQPDVLISPYYSVDHYWLPYLKGKALLIKERHSSYYSTQQQSLSFSKKLKKKLNQYMDAKYDHILVLNKDEKRYVETPNSLVVPNPILLREEIAGLKNKKVIAAGRLAPVKQFDELIRIWSLVQKEVPGWELHIYGEDYLGTKEKLESLIHELRLEDSVKIKNSVPNLLEVMQEYSILAITSKTEGFPMVLLESLSLGIPIVSYDCPHGPRNIVSDSEDGIIVENQNREKFVEALQKLMIDEELRQTLGQNAKKNIKRFSIDNVMNDWKNLLNIH